MHRRMNFLKKILIEIHAITEMIISVFTHIK